MSEASNTPDFSQFETSSVNQRQFYDSLFYILCVFVATLSIVVLGILLSTIMVSALPVFGPHTDGFVSNQRMAIIQSGSSDEADRLLGTGDLLQGVFKCDQFVRGGLGESNDEEFESKSLIGIYSFQVEKALDVDGETGQFGLRPGAGEHSIKQILKAAGFDVTDEIEGSTAIVLLENNSADITLDDVEFSESFVKEGKIVSQISLDGGWEPRMVLGLTREHDFAEISVDSVELEVVDKLRSGERLGKFNCLLSIQYDSEHSEFEQVRNLSAEVGRLIDGEAKVERGNLTGVSRRKSKRKGFDLAGDFELEYCPLPELDASAGTYASHFVQESTKTNPADAGVGPAMIGSLWVIIGCVLFALPIGVATAVFLEEFKPTNRVLLFFHNLVQLNIANLAGVPSIVYGILGLTAFVYMFSDFSGDTRPSSEPTFSFGASHYFQFLTEGMEPILIPVSDPQTPPTLVDGMDATTTNGDPVTLKVIGPDDEYPEDEAVLKFALMHDSEGGIISRKPWYYLQIPFGRGVLAASLTLMLVILPVVIIATQEALRAVPASLREGALGLGSTRWQVVRKITLPAAIPSIMTGAILAMSRAIGEAAPILILCGIVYVTSGPSHLMDDYSVLPIQIYYWAKEPIDRAALINFQNVAAAGIVVLLAVLLTFNAIAILIRQLTQKPLS